MAVSVLKNCSLKIISGVQDFELRAVQLFVSLVGTAGLSPTDFVLQCNDLPDKHACLRTSYIAVNLTLGKAIPG